MDSVVDAICKVIIDVIVGAFFYGLIPFIKGFFDFIEGNYNPFRVEIVVNDSGIVGPTFSDVQNGTELFLRGFKRVRKKLALSDGV